jgi:HEAT repeat protein
MEAVVGFLDLAPAETELGLRYRELVVTHGAAIDALCVLLWEPCESLQLAAADALRDIGDPDVVAELAEILTSQRCRPCRDVDLIIALIEALGACWRPGDASVARAVVGALCDPEEDIRDAAGAVLRQLGPDAMAAAPALIDMLSRPEFAYRFEAVELLPRLTPPSFFARHLLTVLSGDEDSLLRWMALHELEHIEHPDDEIRAAVAAAQSDSGIQEYAAAA